MTFRTLFEHFTKKLYIPSFSWYYLDNLILRPSCPHRSGKTKNEKGGNTKCGNLRSGGDSPP